METYLAHHGILGMKWGVRRYQTDDGVLTAAGKARYGRKATAKRKAAAKKAVKTKKKNAEAKRKEESRRTADERAGKPRDVSTMSDQEIRDFLARKDLESKYLAAVTPQQTQKGESAVKKYMSMFGDSLASAVVKGAASIIAKKLLDSVFDDGKQNNTRDKSNEDGYSSEKKAKEPKKPKEPKAPKTEKEPKEPKESIFDTIKKEKANWESRTESAAKEKVFTGTVEGGRKYTEEHKTKWENKTIIDVDPIPYQKAETFVRALPSYNTNILALPPARDD